MLLSEVLIQIKQAFDRVFQSVKTRIRGGNAPASYNIMPEQHDLARSYVRFLKDGLKKHTNIEPITGN